MTDMEMAVAALRMLHDWPPENRDVVVDLEFTTTYCQPELRFCFFDSAREITRAEYYADRRRLNDDYNNYHFGSFEEGFKRLEELIYGQK